MGLLHRKLLLSIALSVLCVGCTTGPRVREDVVGFGSLLEATRAAETMPSAATLPTLPPDAKRPEYRLGPLDQVTVVVWGRPDLGSQIPTAEGDRKISTVTADGSLGLPFLDRMQVAGKTITEVRKMVESAYSGMIENPQVEVEMAEFRSQNVLVTGAVATPGVRYLTDTERTLGEVITAAGGTTNMADRKLATLTRGESVYRADLLRISDENNVMDVLLQPGDEVNVPSIEERVVYVFGEVRAQGAFPLPDRGMSVLQGVAMAGGFNQVSSEPKKVFLLRQGPDGGTIYRLDMVDLLAGPDVALMPGDRLYLGPTLLAIWARTVNQLLPVFGTVGSITAAAVF